MNHCSFYHFYLDKFTDVRDLKNVLLHRLLYIHLQPLRISFQDNLLYQRPFTGKLENKKRRWNGGLYHCTTDVWVFKEHDLSVEIIPPIHNPYPSGVFDLSPFVY